MMKWFKKIKVRTESLKETQTKPGNKRFRKPRQTKTQQ